MLTLAINSSSVAGFVLMLSGVEDFDCFPIKLSSAEAALLFPGFAGLSRSEGNSKTKTGRVSWGLMGRRGFKQGCRTRLVAKRQTEASAH